MQTIDDGGPAFPQSETALGNTVNNEHGQGGMSLRDYFAGQALIGLLQNGSYAVGQIASSAYSFADAILAARNKPSTTL